MANTRNAVEAGFDVDAAAYVDRFLAHVTAQIDRAEIVDASRGLNSDTALHEFGAQAGRWLAEDIVTPDFVLYQRTTEVVDSRFTWLTHRRKAVNHDTRMVSGWLVARNILENKCEPSEPSLFYYVLASRGLASHPKLYRGNVITPSADAPWGFKFNPSIADRYATQYDQFEARQQIRDGIVALLERTAVIKY